MGDASMPLRIKRLLLHHPISIKHEWYAALLEIGKIDEWMDKNPGIVQEGKLSFLQEINEESNPVCVIVEP